MSLRVAKARRCQVQGDKEDCSIEIKILKVINQYHKKQEFSNSHTHRLFILTQRKNIHINIGECLARKSAYTQIHTSCWLA